MNKETISIHNRYYDFDKESLQVIASKEIKEIDRSEWDTLVQMLYPNNMIASGIIDPFLIFKIREDGKRIDPPIKFYSGLIDAKDHLLKKIVEELTKQGIEIHQSWNAYLPKKPEVEK